MKERGSRKTRRRERKTKQNKMSRQVERK